MLIGYARVSTQDQNLELQRNARTTAGCQIETTGKLLASGVAPKDVARNLGGSVDSRTLLPEEARNPAAIISVRLNRETSA